MCGIGVLHVWYRCIACVVQVYYMCGKLMLIETKMAAHSQKYTKTGTNVSIFK